MCLFRVCVCVRVGHAGMVTGGRARVVAGDRWATQCQRTSMNLCGRPTACVVLNFGCSMQVSMLASANTPPCMNDGSTCAVHCVSREGACVCVGVGGGGGLRARRMVSQ